jgi:hypothetical protein
MSTRAQIRFATREPGVSFNEHPNAIHAQFYKHSDGYPEGLGLDIAESIMDNVGVTNWEIESLTHKHGDLDYIYYIWQYPGKETWISIFQVGWSPVLCVTCDQEVKGNRLDECIFVGLPTDLINKYKINTNNDG